MTPNEPLDLDAIEARAEDDLPAATGDWRDLRYAITQADPTFMQRPEVERDYLWGFAERAIDRFPGLRARCAGCRRQFVWQQVYRCFDCSAPLCKDCIKTHSVGERERLAAELAEFKKRDAEWTEKEAACCPEDVGFPEYIAALTGQRDAALAALKAVEASPMTDTAGRNEPVMPPGRELDSAVQDHVINRAPIGPVPLYSTRWEAMRLVVERLVALGWVVELNDSREFGPSCVLAAQDGSRVVSERGGTLPHAVALAALKAVEASRE